MFDELNPAAEHLFPTEPEQTADKPQQNAIPDQKEVNMRILRERAESAERRSLELERMVQMNMSQQSQNNNKMQMVDSDDDDFDMGDDSYIEGKHLKKYVKSLKQDNKRTRQEFEEYKNLMALNNADIKLRYQFNDFDEVVNKENIAKLQQQKPVLYRTILANTDIYDKGYAAYELIKNSGILTDHYQQLDKKVEENRVKPRSAANAAPQSGDTPLARVGDYDRRVLTEERKDQLRRQVDEAKRYKQ